ncbi:MFS transporter [Streptomyces europaeiscabiei]|uniref:MFS transporter n=1 Tax=Streptomyces europaeiscabiei TaxID=146819 RepID=UPI002E182658
MPAPTSTNAVNFPTSLDRHQWSLLFVLAANMLIDSLELATVLVVLPSAGAALGASLWAQLWALAGFPAGFASGLLLGGRITARWGRRRIFLAALIGYLVAALTAGLAQESGLLIAAQVAKGCCAALTAPVGLAIIGSTFAEGPQRRQAVTVYSLFGAAGSTTGLLLAGSLTSINWRLPLLVPVPVVVLLLVIARRLLPRDTAGAAPEAVVPVRRVVRDRLLLRSAFGAAALNGTFMSLLFLINVQIQSTAGRPPWQAALICLPTCLPLVAGPFFAPRLISRFGTRLPIMVGALSALTGYALYLWQVDPARLGVGLLATVCLVGIGLALSFAPLNVQAVSSASPETRGRSAQLFQTAVQLGAVVLLPAVTALLTGADGHRSALRLVVAVSAAGLLVAVTGLIRRSVPAD